MNDRPDSGSGGHRDADDIAFVLLLLQSGMGLVSALGLLAYARLTGGGAAALLPAFGVPVALLVLAAGVSGDHRWARVAAITFEGLVLIGATLRLFLGGALALNLVMLLSTIAMPFAVAGLLLSHHSGREGAGTRTCLRDSRAGSKPLDTAA